MGVCAQGPTQGSGRNRIPLIRHEHFECFLSAFLSLLLYYYYYFFFFAGLRGLYIPSVIEGATFAANTLDVVVDRASIEVFTGRTRGAPGTLI